MENESEVACFGGQVKTCGDSRIISPQWKSGLVRVYRREDGTMNARMFLNVSPHKPTSQITVLPADLNVKSNRVIVTDAKGMGFYVRLSGPKEIEDSRKVINRLSSYECSKRSKAEVGSFTMSAIKMNGKHHVENKCNGTTDSGRIKMSPSVYTSQRANKLRGPSLSPQLKGSTPTDNGSSQKRRSSELDEGYDSKEYFGGPAEKKSNFTSVKKAGLKSPRLSKSTESGSFKILNSGSFYGKNASKGLGIKEPMRHNLPSVDRIYRAGLVPYPDGEPTNVMAHPSQSQDASVPVTDNPEPDISCIEHDYTGADSSQARSTSDSSTVGFDNLGNTCFINSPLQCLSSLEPLSLDIKDIVEQHGHKLKKESVIRLLYFLMKYVRTHNLKGVRIKTILKVLRETLFGKFAINTQQDAHELLSEILDRVHEEVQELKRLEERKEDDDEGEDVGDILKDETGSVKERLDLPSTSSADAKKKKKIRERLSRYILSPTEKNFTWFFKNSFHYHECKRQVWSQEEHDTTLMLAFTSKSHLHLQDCVDDYFKSCDVEFKCESCDKNEGATITRKIIRRPRCLILNLLRYQTDSVESKKKLDSVSIPRYISIADFCVEDVKDPLYIHPVLMSEKESPDEGEEIMLQFLQKAQEEIKAESNNRDKSESSFSRVPEDQVKNADSDTSAVKTESHQMEVSLPENVNNDRHYHQTANHPVGGGEKPTGDEKTETGSSESVKRKSLSQDLGSQEKGEEEDEISSLNVDLLKKQKLEERLKCRGGAVEGLAPIHVDIGEDEAFFEFNDGEEEEDSSKGNRGVFPSSCASTFTHTKGRSGSTLTGVDDDVSTGYEASSEGDSSQSTRVDGVKCSQEKGGNGRSLNTCEKATNVSMEGVSDGCGGDALFPILDEHGLENEDLDNKMLCGRAVCQYSETDLQALDLNALTDNEMLLYAQALSRFEYIKEKGAELVAYRAATSVIDDISADYSSLECEPSLAGEGSHQGYENSCKRVQDFDNVNNLRSDATLSSISVDSSSSRTRGRKNVDDRIGREESSSEHMRFSEADSIFNEFESSGMSPRAASKVPDIFESSFDTALREEASFHEERMMNDAEERDKDQSRVLQSWGPSKTKLQNSPANSSHQLEESGSSSSQISQIGSQLRLEQCIFCNGPISDGQCFKCDSATRDFGCVPMDECFSVDDGNVSEEQSSKSSILSETGNKNMGFTSASKVVGLPYFQDLNLTDIWSGGSSLPSPANKKTDKDAKFPLSSSSSAFQKPKQDMYIASPSKTKNLVKTRDYSRLRSPITSPRKKPSKISPQRKTPAANKQLIFPENEKVSWEKSLDKPLSSLPVPNSAENVSVNTDSEEGEISVVIDDIYNTEPINKAAEPDSSLCQARQDAGPSNPTAVDKGSSKLLQAVNTSTPITSLQESSSKAFQQQPLHVSVPSAASHPGSADCAVKTTASQSSQAAMQAPPGLQNVSQSSEGPQRSKASRSLSVSFAAAEEKENSGDTNEEEQARRKRFIHIESGESDCSYRLVGIVNHHGESLFAGHYTSYSFNLHKQKWFYLDDKHTKETSEATVRRESMCNGYVFFYMDKNLFDSYSSMKDAAVSFKHSPT